ncbi:glutathione S-transferase family protein [Roseibium sp. RKSG952]|uniref:glutathione S-transferase family protein n=1 Tax=Roseibium sp. RKSG952 TaxID=2529384 RepID=UPI0012BB606F|nr:glutathione S-transferase family protein [Roseibium sp. RKSG952]MTH96890.1 glutathione S-transferase family protein [Roseibium sp. RKSG952]
MGDLIFYTNPMSRGRIVRWMLEETGVPYETRIVGYGPEMKSEDYRKVNPVGKVPALVHDGKIVTECAAICLYLADAFPDAGLAPEPKDRADYYRWMFFTAGPMESCLTHRSMGHEVPEERRQSVGFAAYDEMLDAIEHAIAGKTHIANDRFSAADVYVGANLGFGMQFGTIEHRPAFETYVAGLQSRPAFKRAIEIDEKLMPAQPAAAS